MSIPSALLPSPHALAIPCPAQGHINPLMSLASYLASSGILVTFVHSQRNYSLLQLNNENLQPHSRIRFEVVPDTMLPDVMQKPTTEHVAESILNMENGIEQLIQKLNKEEDLPPVSCIISDSFLPWTQDVANKFRIPRVEFWTSCVSSYLIGYSLPQLVDKGYLPITPGTENRTIHFLPGLSPFPVSDLPTSVFVEDISDLQFFIRAFQRGKEAERVIVNSFYDLESSAVDALRAEQIAIYPVGPLLPSTNKKLPVASLLPEDDECLKWLDVQADLSVIYVSFGSKPALSVIEIEELAIGLENSQQPFLWVISLEEPNSEIFPEGFLTRTKDRGLMISWAPQMAVLSHRAVGGFLTHCGWNSTMESLWAGVPMIGCPRKFAEQNTNLKFLRDWKVGMALLKGSEEMSRSSVEGGVRALMQGEEGKEARKRALEMRAAAQKALAQGGPSSLALHCFVQDMKQMVRTT